MNALRNWFGFGHGDTDGEGSPEFKEMSMRNQTRSQLVLAAFVLFGLGCANDAENLATRSGVSPAADGGANDSLRMPTPTIDKPNGLAKTAADAAIPSAGRAGSANPPIVAESFNDTGPNNPAGLADADVKKLMAGGPLGMMRLLYPYEGTVFPRGTYAPVVMWDGADATDAVYLHIKSKNFEYKGILKPGVEQGIHTIAGVNDVWANLIGQQKQKQVQFPQAIWDKAGEKSEGKSDPFTLELSARTNGAVAGPVVLHFNIAQATITGAVFYNTYDEWKLNAADLSATTTELFSGGKVMRIPLGGTAELFSSASDGCYGCHSVSANGSRVIAHLNPPSAIVMSPSPFMGQAASFLLSAGGPPLPKHTLVGPRGSFAALYPDGSKYLATGLQTDIGGEWNYEPFGNTATDAKLYDSTSGQAIANTGIPVSALMPNFSPDGTRLVFNDYAINKAHGLAVMRYDVHANLATDYHGLTQSDAGDAMRPAFPFFLPDDAAVVFARTDGPDFTSGLVGSTLSNASTGATGQQSSDQKLASSDLHIVDLKTGTVTMLARAMGFTTPADAASGATYLPFGANDLHNNYSPTVLPVALGGYFWVFFDSRRNFGNLGLQRQIWGAAIDIRSDGSYVVDPSHPAFYLPGQGFGANNHRAFAALSPCKNDRDACSSGIDCCTGSCAADGVCAPPPPNSCAKRNERCTSAADCCDSNDYCINNFCAQVELR
jgi:hypothetical protein